MIPVSACVRDGTVVLIRSAEAQDAVGILELIGELMSSGSDAREPGENEQSVEQTRDWIRHCDHASGHLVLVAELCGGPVGFLGFSSGPYQRIAHRGLVSLCVAAAWRRRGIGAQLLQSFLQWAEREPLVEKVCATILATNQASISLYQQLGFIEESRRKKEYRVAPDTYVDEIYMSRFVKASVPGECRSTLTSPVHTGQCADPQVALEDLLAAYVRLPVPSPLATG